MLPMHNIKLTTLLPRLLHETSLQSVTISQVFSFVTLSSSLKCSIHLHQPVQHTFDTVPFTLPPSVALFLANAVTVPLETVPLLWNLLKDAIWSMPPDDNNHHSTLEIFKTFGWPLGISKCCRDGTNYD